MTFTSSGSPPGLSLQQESLVDTPQSLGDGRGASNSSRLLASMEQAILRNNLSRLKKIRLKLSPITLFSMYERVSKLYSRYIHIFTKPKSIQVTDLLKGAALCFYQDLLFAETSKN